MRRRLIFAAVLAATVSLSGPASAGAWTKPKGEGLAIYTLSLHQLLPADGYEGHNRLKNEVSLYTEYGLTDRITLVGRAAFQTMQITDMLSEEIRYTVKVKPPYDPRRDDPDADYDGDGVPNRSDPAPPAEPRFERRSKTSFYRPAPESGVGGVEAGLRYRLLQSGRWAVSVQGLAGIPANGENRNNRRFGEGGGSFDLRVQAGRSFGRSTFVNVAAGLRSLPGSQPEEVRLDLTAGTHIARGVRVMAQTYSVWAVSDSVLRRDNYSGHRAQVSVLWPIDSQRRVQLAALTTLGRNEMSRETAVMASLWRSF